MTSETESEDDMVIANNRIQRTEDQITSILSEKTQLSRQQLHFMSRFWMGTWQEVGIKPTENIFAAKKKEVKYIIFQLERAPTTGKLHYQLYIEFVKRVRLCTLMRSFPHCYWSNRRGTAEQAIAYCSKEDTRVEPTYSYGEPTLNIPDKPLVATPEAERKKVSALQIVCNKLSKGTYSLNDLMKEHPSVFIRNHSGITRYLEANAPERNWKPEVIVLYGLPECGKSRTARELSRQYYKPEDIYKYSMLDTSGKEWWENYTGQPCVIIEEMEGCKLKFERLLELIDRFDTRVPCKGGSYQFLAHTIIFTSNYPPSSWYPTKLWAALRRRIDRTYMYNLLEEETLNTGLLIFEPELNQKEMHNSDVSEHNAEVIKMFKDQGYVKKRHVETMQLSDNELVIMKEKELSEEENLF